MKKILSSIKWLFTTKIGWFIVCLVLGCLIMKCSEWLDSEFLYWAGLAITVLYPGGLILVAIVYAWIINPYREWKQRQ